MVRFVLTPDWFLGFDVLIEFFSFIVLAIFSFLSLQSYTLNRNKKNFMYVGMGFGLIAFAQLASILAKIFLYYDIAPIQEVGTAIISNNIVNSVDIFYHIGFFFYRFLTLAGLYMIYNLHHKKIPFENYLLFAYFIFLSAILSREIFYLFHLTALFLLLMIVRNYVRIYKENKFLNTKMLITAFGMLAISQIFFLFASGFMQATANLVELISYALLLFLAIKIRKDGKKKKQNGDYIGYAGSNSAKRRKN